MAAKEGLTTSAQITVAAREIDFVTRFNKNWDALRDIMGIMRPIRKTPGTKLASYKARVDGELKGGTTVGEGEEIPFTKLKVEPVAYGDIEIGKYGRSVSIEAVAKYGEDIAVQRSDEAFLNALQSHVLTDFFTFMKSGTLTSTEATWQRALAMAKGSVLDKFASMDIDATEVVGFANILDAYSYMGDKDISVQSQFGINYIKDFLGYRTLFLLPEKYIDRGEVIALPVENIDLYYIDPSDSDFVKMGLSFRTVGETNLIGAHVEGNYSRATGDMYVIMGMKLWAEYLDGIAVVTVSGAAGASTAALNDESAAAAAGETKTAKTTAK